MQALDVQELIDRFRFSRLHLLMLVLAMLAMFIDGFDIFMIGRIAPAIAEGFKVTSAQLTQVFVFQQIGLAAGSFAVSPLADFFGRKRLLCVSFVIFGLLTVAGAYAQTILQLALLRGVAGLFLAGVLPMALALVSEVTPSARRSAVTGLAMAGYGVGNAAGASAAFLVPTYGWQGAFWLGGLMALFLALVLMWLLPESIAYLVARKPDDPRIAKMLLRFAPALTLSGEEQFALPQGLKHGKVSLLDVFAQRRTMVTIVAWACFMLSMGNITLIAAWVPTFFKEMAGISIQEFAGTLIIGLFGSLAGISSIGFLMDRLKPIALVTGYYVGNAVALSLLGLVPFHSPAFLPLLITFSFFQGGGQGGLNILLSQLYPPQVRSTGLGWAGGIGRIGGIIAPLFGGYALSSSFTLQTTLGLIAISPALVAALLVLVFRPALSRSKKK